MNTDLNKDKLKAIRLHVQKLLDANPLDGMTMTMGNCSFTATEATFKLAIKTEGNADAVLEQAEQMANLYGLKRTVSADGVYKLIRYDTKKHKMPFIVEKAGKPYKITLEAAQRIFA